MIDSQDLNARIERLRKAFSAEVEAGRMVAEELELLLDVPDPDQLIERLRRIFEEEVQSDLLSADVVDRIVKMKSENYRQLKEDWLARLTQMELAVFKHQLHNRQGTVLPDFDAIYQERKELDRKMFEGGP